MEGKLGNSLTRKMVFRIISGFFVGIFCCVFIYFGCIGHLKGYLQTSGYWYRSEQGRADELQEYINELKLPTPIRCAEP